MGGVGAKHLHSASTKAVALLGLKQEIISAMGLPWIPVDDETRDHSIGCYVVLSIDVLSGKDEAELPP